LPKEGFTSITISEETYEKLKKFAEETHRSIPQAIEYLIEQHGEIEVKGA
jgi:predicted CopG family antitoxin